MHSSKLLRISCFVIVALLGCVAVNAAAGDAKIVELFQDLNFERGFQVVDGAGTKGILNLSTCQSESGTSEKVEPVWKLAQHNSKYDLTKGKIEKTNECSSSTTPGQRVELKRDSNGELTLTLSVTTDKDYSAPRRPDQPWIHLLLVQDFPPAQRVSFADVESMCFSCDARVIDWKRMMTDEEFDPGVHTTQASVYFAISNDNPKSPDYRDYIWFGISFFDDRYEVQSQYIEVDGDPKKIGTGKLIYRLGEQKTIDDLMGGINPYSREWVHIEIDIAKYIEPMLTAARERGFLENTTPGDLKMSHFNYGWETPGTYRSSMAVKNLHLKATMK